MDMDKNISWGDFDIFHDKRGFFSPISLLDNSWVQSNISFNKKKHTFRGLHYQEGEFAQKKIVFVLKGEIYDYLYDLKNKTLHQYHLRAGEYIVVPKEYAHGFTTLKKNTLIQYFVDKPYSPQNERIINAKGLVSKKYMKVISQKDKEA
jgi:dTDP-4-dehydrorhamnose 3,5-epimerase